MLNLVQATKYDFMCWQQRDLVGTYHERFMATLEVAEAVDSMIVRNIATSRIVIKEWDQDTSDPRSITEEKREADFAEGEKRFQDTIFFYGLLYHKYGKLKDNVQNSYLAGDNIIQKTYDAVLRMSEGLKTDYGPSALHWQGAEEKGRRGFFQSGRSERKEECRNGQVAPKRGGIRRSEKG